MSLILKTIQAFPRGRTTEELLVLVGAGFSHDKRVAAIAELDELLGIGLVVKGRDGRWRPKHVESVPRAGGDRASGTAAAALSSDIITAVPATFSRTAAGEDPVPEEDEVSPPDPQALLRYWRSALRADPRGTTTQVADKHGVEWALISGRGPIAPTQDDILTLTIDLDALDPAFREAMVRREGNENALAVGWPIAVARRGGVPIFQPVGLLVASWERCDGNLILRVDADDVLVNPDWLRDAARLSGWRREALSELFDAGDGLGLHAADFVDKLRDAVASQIRGRIVGEDLASQLDARAQGIFDSAGVFLPTDSSFTAGAARDLDAISTWPVERLSRTSLAPVLGLGSTNTTSSVPAVNVGPLNGEQLRAVRQACSEPLTVVTGPPGTGKSQAIVSMAASVLLSGGSVVVASKNHQALDAVEDRLGALAPDTSFVTRTLKPEEELDVGFFDAIKQLIDNDQAAHGRRVDDLALADLADAAVKRAATMDLIERVTEIECEIAELLDRIDFREKRQGTDVSVAEEVEERLSLLSRLFGLFARLFRRKGAKPEKVATAGLTGQGATLLQLRTHLQRLREERDNLATPEDPIAMGEAIGELVRKVLPSLMAQRTQLSEERRQEIADLFDDWTFSGGRGHPPTDLSRALVDHRPLWLASILGTPRRIPLDDGLFDLVIFDEASQCDIATAIPLFARAKRAVVVGDDKQLSFIPQLGQAQDRNLMQAQNLPIDRMGRFAQSRRSLFDFASRVPGVARTTLRHQYRSAGPIVEYISENFYGGQLETSYDPRATIVPKGFNPGIAWENVPAPGIPQNGNVNPAEVSAIVRHLKTLLLDQDYEGTIGVISPFRAQVAALQNAIVSAIPETRQAAAKLRIGTVDGFQGQERDLILFSPCVGPRSPQSGLTFFQRDARRLNVAISRARAVAMIFGDLEFARSGQSKALQRLAAKATEQRTRTGEGVFDSDWERRVYYALRDRGLDPHPQHEIAGRRLDFALFGANGVKLDVEVDGRRWHETPDGRRKTSDLWRDHQLKSMGWRVRRFWVDELSRDMEGCLDIIERDLS